MNGAQPSLEIFENRLYMGAMGYLREERQTGCAAVDGREEILSVAFGSSSLEAILSPRFLAALSQKVSSFFVASLGLLKVNLRAPMPFECLVSAILSDCSNLSIGIVSANLKRKHETLEMKIGFFLRRRSCAEILPIFCSEYEAHICS